jgi:hypothetical protein
MGVERVGSKNGAVVCADAIVVNGIRKSRNSGTRRIVHSFT